jgi:hypothetical protein
MNLYGDTKKGRRRDKYISKSPWWGFLVTYFAEVSEQRPLEGDQGVKVKGTSDRREPLLIKLPWGLPSRTHALDPRTHASPLRQTHA